MYNINRFLNKKTIINEELLQHQLSEIALWIKILGAISLVSVLILAILTLAIKKKRIDDTIALAVLPIILLPMMGFIYSIGLYLLYPQVYHINKAEITINAEISEIKDHITIHDNVLTIEPLPNQYDYVSSSLDNTKSQQFLILGNQDNQMTIKDINGREYRIDWKPTE